MIYDCGVDESVMIGENIQLTVLEIIGRSVRVAIRQSGPTPKYWETILKAGDCDLDQDRSFDFDDDNDAHDNDDDDGDDDDNRWSPGFKYSPGLTTVLT